MDLNPPPLALGANSTTDAPSRSYMLIYGEFFIGGSVVIVVSIILAIWYAMKRKAPLVSTLPLWLAYVTMGDFIADSTFIFYMPRSPKIVGIARTCSIAFLAIASAINILVMAGYLWWAVYRGGPKFDPFVRWLRHHKVSTTLIVLSAFSSGRMISLMHSGLFGMDVFSAPLPLSAMETLDVLGLSTVVLEDVPQLIINVLVSTYTDTWDSVAFTALGFSILSIFVSAGLRGLTLLLLRDEERMKAGDGVRPEQLKTHAVYRKGSTRTGAFRYVLDEHAEGGMRGMIVETRMPEVAAALRATAAASSAGGSTDVDRQAASGSGLPVHMLYSVVSAPLVTPTTTDARDKQVVDTYELALAQAYAMTTTPVTTHNPIALAVALAAAPPAPPPANSQPVYELRPANYMVSAGAEVDPVSSAPLGSVENSGSPGLVDVQLTGRPDSRGADMGMVGSLSSVSDAGAHGLQREGSFLGNVRINPFRAAVLAFSAGDAASPIATGASDAAIAAAGPASHAALGNQGPSASSSLNAQPLSNVGSPADAGDAGTFARARVVEDWGAEPRAPARNTARHSTVRGWLNNHANLPPAAPAPTAEAAASRAGVRVGSVNST